MADKKYSYENIIDFINNNDVDGLKSLVEHRHANQFILNQLVHNNSNVFNYMVDLSANPLIEGTLKSLFDVIDISKKCESGYNMLTYMVSQSKTSLSVEYLDFLVDKGLKYKEFNGSELYHSGEIEDLGPKDFLLQLLGYYQSSKLGYFVFHMDEDFSVEELEKYIDCILNSFRSAKYNTSIDNADNFYNEMRILFAQGEEIKSNVVHFLMTCEDKIKEIYMDGHIDEHYFSKVYAFYEAQLMKDGVDKNTIIKSKSVKL